MEKEALKHKLMIGTSGYSYPGPPPKGWFGVFYPEARRRGFDELEYYSGFFDAVEINTTFYRPPGPGMAEAWVRKTGKLRVCGENMAEVHPCEKDR